jgi:hypothetical protein
MGPVYHRPFFNSQDMLKRTLIPLFALFTIVTGAQNYTTAIGLRLGFGAGLTFKQMFNGKSALELIAAYQYNEKGYTFTGLYEVHNYRVLGAAHLALVYGGGVHVGYYDGGLYKNRSGIYYSDNTLNFGLDAILGIDYFEPGSSINWSIDIKPMFDFVNPGFRFWDAGASIRYAF